MSSDGVGGTHTRRLFAVLITGYSHRFRERFGDELTDVITAVWADSRESSPLARAFLALRLAGDLLLGIVADRARGLLPPREPGRGIRRSQPPLPTFLDSTLADTRIALRALRQHRAFALTVILTLGVGIGGVTAMWSVVYGVLLRPLPYAHADRLVRAWGDLRWNPELASQYEPYRTSSPAQIVAWQEPARTIEALAAIGIVERTIEGANYVSRVPTGIVTANFFDLLGAKPALGRVFRTGEDRNGAGAVAILSNALWRREFGANPAIVGRSIRVNGTPTEIIGIAPPDFRWIDRVERKGITDVELWTTQAMDPTNHLHYFEVIARLRPGVTLPNVALELGSLVVQEDDMNWSGAARDNPAARIHIEPAQEALYGTVRGRVLLPLAAVLLVLLLACANTATLLLSRLPARRAELAMRAALGASRVRLVRQMLTESIVLASLAALVGVVLAYWATRAIAILGPREITRIDEVSVSGPALAASAIIAVVCAIVFGLAPAWRGSRTDLARDLMRWRVRPNVQSRAGGRGILLSAQFAVALVLLVGAMLVARSFGRLMAIDTGFDHEHTVSVWVNLPAASYRDDLGPLRGGAHAVRFRPSWDQFIAELVRRVERDPRVASASAGNFTPLLYSDQGPFLPEGVDTTSLPKGEDGIAAVNPVDANHFRTLNIPLLEGRAITEQDQMAAAPVAVVNRTLARRFWPGQSAVGKRFVSGVSRLDADSIRWERTLVQIVGVVGDTREAGYLKPPMAQVYMPFSRRRNEVYWSSAARGLTFTVLVRAKSGDAASLAEVVRREARAIDPQVPVSQVRSLDWLVNEEVRSPRFYAFLFSLFGGFALVLAMAGVFGVLAFTVSQRTHEIGVRMALGAHAGAVVGLVVRQVAIAASAGVIGGILVSAAATKLVRGLLFEVQPTDPTSLALSVALLLTAACVAAWVPARRAVRVDPALSLRAD